MQLQIVTIANIRSKILIIIKIRNYSLKYLEN